MLKTIFMKKTSTLLASLLFLSILMPVIGYAASGFSNIVYNANGTVTGQVYSSVYGSVSVNVYSQDGTRYLTPVEATYVNADVYGNYWYNFTMSVTDASYNPLILKSFANGVQEAVSSNVYRQPVDPGCTSNCPPSSGGGNGGGGGGSNNNAASELTSNGTLNADVLKASLAAHLNVTIKLTGETLTIPVSALVDAAKKPGATLTVVNENGTYELPLSVLSFDNLTELKLEMKKLTGDASKAVLEAISAAGASSLSEVVDFNLTAITTDGKSMAINDFGQTYVKRKLPLNKDASKTTTIVMYDPVTKKLIFVPGKVTGKEAQFMRTGNSIYTVVEVSNTFSDIKSHWAKANIELLASKLIVEGTAADIFEADRNITRAEFAALVTRSLGLTASATSATYFTDVKAGEWYTGVVAAAKAAGLIDGYEDGSFKPNASITREELAAMVVRALKFAGQDTTVSASEQAALLAKFTDANKIVWAKNEIAAAVKAGIVDGMTDTTIASNENATRAQSATMLKRLLSKAGFIE
ncbi:S-layer homology domain-containing protein [Paenibacillus sp. MBLB4367]|uniref:S-layer homology domain-containing protein n=1 Tax=Paenibacillus sp. MBLB4367 TaxID=3384767 RepID=UPI003907F859